MKKSFLAVILSFILPGLGHLYLGLMKKGLVLAVIGITFSVLMELVSVVFVFLFLIVWIYALIDSVKRTKIINSNFSA